MIKITNKRKASFFLAVLISFLLLTPTFAATFTENTKTFEYLENSDTDEVVYTPVEPFPPIPYDTNYVPIEDVSLDGEQNDIGYNTDIGDELRRASTVYIGEPVDETIPGRGRTGELNPADRDENDFYRFTACAGQTISASVSGASATFELFDVDGEPISNGYLIDITGTYYINIVATDDIGGSYTFDVTLTGQNDAGSGSDAGNSIGSALSITPGSYEGYMDYNDVEDWYSFTVASGTGITVYVDPVEKSDYDIHLYNPAGTLVESAQYYGEDTLEYMADASGTWTIKLDMFPGWDESLWPENYFLYGSGPYDLELSLGGDISDPVIPEPQPDITPIAQTFIINDDPTSNKDEYGYLAAVPAANYIDQGKRYVSPIVYQGIDDVPTWFTTVDETTQYLLDDWDDYLSRHDMTSEIFTLPADPIEAAAEIAKEQWTTADTIVIAPDGSSFIDEQEIVVDETVSMNTQLSRETISSDDEKLHSALGYTMYLGKEWGAIALRAYDVTARGDSPPTIISNILPSYLEYAGDWWPIPYDNTGTTSGDSTDIFFPVSSPGFWSAATAIDGDEFGQYEIIKIPGDRYNIPVTDSDTSIEVEITTDDPSTLIVYLVDPDGDIRRPMMPHYNGGEIKPIHYWNGGHWQQDQNEFRRMIIDEHTEYTVDVHNAMPGTWTAIVVPYVDEEGNTVAYTGDYHITIEKRNYHEKRLNAALSAANAAVIASMKHAPLLYVEESEVPSVTADVINQLGGSDIIFVNIEDVSTASVDATETLSSMQEVIDYIKQDEMSENFITVTSLGTGDGYFAPAAMSAAYHTSPILNIGEATDAYNTIDKITAFREYSGDYYHGALSVGHLHQLSEPINLENPPSLLQLFVYFLQHDQTPPPLGLDLKLQWFGTVAQDLQQLIQDYGLDREGKEAFLFVSPRDTDIRDVACRAVTGNESYAGHIPVETPGFSSALICRNILYPAIIYANPGRDVVTSQLMNYPDGYTWQANDGNGYPNYATQHDKESFISRGRFYEGHVIIENLIERYNKGAVFSYYSGHGTGGSGISGQYRNVAEDFPYAELRHESLHDFEWWDAWRGYSGYDNRQTKTPREGGESGYNSLEPSLYDIVHFKWCDQLFENLHSEIEVWSSCTTGEHLGPIVYLSHGSAMWYGCAGSAYGVQDDLHNSWTFEDVLVHGESFGEAESKYVWMFNRDFTTLDPTTLYGRSTLFQITSGGLTNLKVLFGDPTLKAYAPDWIEPTPIEG